MSNDDKGPKQDNKTPDSKKDWIFIPPVESLPYDVLPPDSNLTVPVAPDATSFKDMKFNLADLPEAKPAEPEKPQLSKGERKRALNKVRADLDYADRNNDGRLDTDELYATTNAAKLIEDGSTSIVEQIVKQFVEDQTLNKALTFPQNSTGLQQAPYINIKPKTDMVIADHVLMDRDILTQNIAEKLGVEPKDVDTIIRKVLPKGVDEIRLSTECERHEGLLCAPDPAGVRYSIAPKERT